MGDQTVRREIRPLGWHLESDRYLVETQQGLTTCYNRLKDPEENDERVLELRRLHEDLDRAVLEVYGWSDIVVPPFETPETEEGKRRLESFEDETIDRLVVSNAQRAEEERRLGLAAVAGGKGGTKVASKAKGLTGHEGQGGYFEKPYERHRMSPTINKLLNAGLIVLIFLISFFITQLLVWMELLPRDDSKATGLFLGALVCYAVDSLAKAARSRDLESLKTDLAQRLDDYRLSTSEKLEQHRTSLLLMGAADRGRIVATKQAAFFEEYMANDSRCRHSFANQLDQSSNSKLLLAWVNELIGIRRKFMGWLPSQLEEVLKDYEQDLLNQMVEFRKEERSRKASEAPSPQNEEKIEAFLSDLLQERKFPDGKTLSDWCREAFGVNVCISRLSQTN